MVDYPNLPKEVWHLERHEKMSLIEIFRMEKFLATGVRWRHINISNEERRRVQEEYPISALRGDNRFVGDPEAVWDILKRKYPEQTQKYKGYKACQYALKYGAEPVEWRANV